MRIMWTLFKIMLGLAIAIPVGIFVLALTVGVVGTFVRLAMVALRFACVGFVGYGLFRLGRHLIGPAPVRRPPPALESPRVDPYYEAAMRELDTELGTPSHG